MPTDTHGPGVDEPIRRPTLRDVADHAGVSFKTVSRVVNGEGGVSIELSDRVANSIEQLGYRPDSRARHLRHAAAQTGTIGFILSDVANPFFSAILRGIDDVAGERGALVLTGSTDGDPDRESQLVDSFVSRRVDGLIVVPTARGISPSLLAEIRRGTPVVFVDLEPDDGEVVTVRTDHRGGAELATRHLIDAGHRDIACFADDRSIFSAAERIVGFRRAMTAAGLAVPPDRVVDGDFGVSGWRDLATEYLARADRPTAVFTAQNFVTIGTAHALHQLGLHHTIAHVGFDDVDLADVIDPPITVIPQQPRLLGQLAAQRLFDRADGVDTDSGRNIVPCELLARGSGEITAADPTAGKTGRR
jgi:LacI family transcriptional regulator